MNKCFLEILNSNANYDQTIKILNKHWNNAKTREERELLIRFYCELSGKTPSELQAVIDAPKEYIHADGKRWIVIPLPSVADQLEKIEERRERARKSPSNLILTKFMGSDTVSE